ncbi:MAG: Gfo/Idh/MocA family oxidoreductase, partial [Gemmatimonadetes bacterium]|nr:Gfo/Idh/MocA family oxidoreductase [Gemmatimonadota bacterium]
MIDFAVVGTGWRTEFYLRCARACPDRFRITGVVSRDPSSKTEMADTYGVDIVSTIDELLARETPQFVVSSVPWTINPLVIQELAGHGMPVLSETPPATSVDEMNALCDLVTAGAKIQVAEQFHLQPLHAARISYARGGKIGRVSQVQMSVCHGYHGISLMRRLLGIGFEDAAIRARTFTAPIVKSPDRDGPQATEQIE